MHKVSLPGQVEEEKGNQSDSERRTHQPLNLLSPKRAMRIHVTAPNPTSIPEDVSASKLTLPSTPDFTLFSGQKGYTPQDRLKRFSGSDRADSKFSHAFSFATDLKSAALVLSRQDSGENPLDHTPQTSRKRDISPSLTSVHPQAVSHDPHHHSPASPKFRETTKLPTPLRLSSSPKHAVVQPIASLQLEDASNLQREDKHQESSATTPSVTEESSTTCCIWFRR